MLTQQLLTEIRNKFPVTKNLVYFDHAAVAPISTACSAAINEYLDDLLNFGDKNYSQWFRKSEEIREGMARFINAEADEIAFIKNTSQGLSIVAGGLNFQPGDNVVIPDIEFPANVYPWLNLQKQGVQVRFVHSINGEVPLKTIENQINGNTKIVSVSSVEFSSGYRNNLKAIGNLIRKKSEEFGRKIYFCVDAIQSLGAFKIDVKECHIDFLSADGHKWFLTPEGAGIFYCNRASLNELHPTSIGWKSVNNPLNFSTINFELQPSARKFEEGSLNMMGVIGLGVNLDLFNSITIEVIQDRILYLTRLALEALKEKQYEISSPHTDEYRSGIITFKTFRPVEQEYDYFIQNHIQLAIRGGNLRISPHFYNSEEEINRFKSLLR